MIISVTQEDIDNGVKSSSCSCPIALSMKRMGLDEVEVNGYDLYFVNEYENRSILPVKALSFIENFDNGVNVTPFFFDVQPERYYTDDDNE